MAGRHSSGGGHARDPRRRETGSDSAAPLAAPRAADGARDLAHALANALMPVTGHAELLSLDPAPRREAALAARVAELTGTSGRVGTFNRQHLEAQGLLGSGAGQWRLRPVDVRPPEDAGPEDEVIAGEVEGNLAELEVAHERRSALGAAPGSRPQSAGGLLCLAP